MGNIVPLILSELEVQDIATTEETDEEGNTVTSTTEEIGVAGQNTVTVVDEESPW